jgi:tetratricopeptide (TPR) repeat protein
MAGLPFLSHLTSSFGVPIFSPVFAGVKAKALTATQASCDDADSSKSMHARMFARTIAYLCLLAFALALGPAPARAQGDEGSAHQAFLSGQASFNAGRYEEALQQFRESYRLSSKPELLLTLAQTMRKLGQFDEAIAYVEKYLASEPPQAMQRPTYEFLGQLRAEKKQAKASAAAATATSAQRPLVETPPPSAPVDARKRKLAIGLGVGGAVVLVAVGVTLGVVLGTSSSNDYPHSALGTVRFSP